MVEGKNVAFIDTPGFRDPGRSYAEILVDIVAGIKKNIGTKHKITAALYFHNIETSRMFESAQGAFQQFEQIVGRDAFSGFF
jgi:GTPase Era involved in 16S rRNA processing